MSSDKTPPKNQYIYSFPLFLIKPEPNWQLLCSSQRVAPSSSSSSSTSFFSSFGPALELRVPLEHVNEDLSSEWFWNPLNIQQRLRMLSSKGGGNFEVDVETTSAPEKGYRPATKTTHLKLIVYKRIVPVRLFSFYSWLI